MANWKRQPYRNKKILNAARGEQCTIGSPECNGNPETTIAAHSNYYEDGKGKGLKADDCFVAFACSSCHRWLDEGTDPMRRDLFHRGMKRTWRRILDKGVLK